MSLSPTVSERPTPSVSESTRCPECSGDVRQSGTESVCQGCGLIVDVDLLDRGPEWRAFADDETNPERTGAPVTNARHDRGLHSTLGNYSDYQQLPASKRRRIARLRKQHQRTVIGNRRERSQVYAFTEVRRFASRLDLPERVTERACQLVQDAQDEGLITCLDGTTAASVYAASRLSQTTRSIAEIVQAARVDHERIRTCFDALNRGLALALAPPKPREYLPRLASHLDLPTVIETDARGVLEATEDGAVVGKNPCGVAAAALYTAAQDTSHRVTQADAADAAGITPTTLRASRDVLADGAGGLEGGDA